LRIATHARVFPKPLTARRAFDSLAPLLDNELVTGLRATARPERGQP
jgi:hypothetical protein